jgi:sugar phosphate isomerase/epimerase
VSVPASSVFRVGLNPYGLTYTLGLQGLDTPRANRQPLGLSGFVRLAREVGARTLELDLRWLTPLDDRTLMRVADDAAADGMTVVCSTWLRHEPGETLDDARRIARVLGAALIRIHLAPVLEGARAALGGRWSEMVAHARGVLIREAARARDEGLRIGIENHQDFGSEELLAFADEAGDNVGIVLDTGNPFAVGEDPVAFTERVAHRLLHVHLKDYRAQFTDEGYRLVRCAIGEGCVPLELVARVIERQTPNLPVTASLEPAALEARHIRLFTAEWWHGYPARDARELAVAIGRLRRRRLDRFDDYRTPWEQDVSADELVAYEGEQLVQSVGYVQSMGWM